MEEVRIDDDFFEEAGKTIQEKGKVANKVVLRYISLLRETLETGLIEGETARAFGKFVENVERYKDVIDDLTVLAYKNAVNLVENVDEIDGDLYGV